MKKIALILALSLAQLAFFGLIKPVSAQTSDPFHISISPPVAYVQIKPGDTLNHTITIQHRGTVPLTVTPMLVDFTPSDAGQGINLSDVSTFPYLTGDSKTKAAETFTLEPGQKHNLTLQINPPAGAIEREYHLTLLFKTQPATSQTPAIGAEVTGTIGSNLVVLVSGGDRNRGQLHLKEVKIPKIVDSLSGLRFTLLAENTGVMATQASGSATLTDWRGQKVADFELYPDMVLAQTSRLLRPSQPATDSAQSVPNPVDKPEFVYKPWFLIGPYTLTVNLNQTPANAEPVTYQVIAVPLSFLLALLVGGIIYLVYGFFKPKLPLGR